MQRLGTAFTTLAWIRDNNTKYEVHYRKQGVSTWTIQAVSDSPGSYLISTNITILPQPLPMRRRSAAVCDGGNTITVRARGVTGQEHVNIKVNNTTIGSVTLTTTFQNYTFQTTQNGGLIVIMIMTRAAAMCRWIMPKSMERFARPEAQSFNTGYYVNGQCGGGGIEMAELQRVHRF